MSKIFNCQFLDFIEFFFFFYFRIAIKSNQTRLIKTLKLAREDFWNKGRHWGKIAHAQEEMKRVKWYLSNLNMRSPKTQMRIGFL